MVLGEEESVLIREVSMSLTVSNTTHHAQPEAVTSSEKKELPQVTRKPTTLCIVPRQGDVCCTGPNPPPGLTSSGLLL